MRARVRVCRKTARKRHPEGSARAREAERPKWASRRWMPKTGAEGTEPGELDGPYVLFHDLEGLRAGTPIHILCVRGEKS